MGWFAAAQFPRTPADPIPALRPMSDPPLDPSPWHPPDARRGAPPALHRAFLASCEDAIAAESAEAALEVSLRRLPERWRGLGAAALARRRILADGFAGWMAAAGPEADALAVAGLARLGQAEAERALVAAREIAGFPDPADPGSAEAIWTRLEEQREAADEHWQRFRGDDEDFERRLAAELQELAELPAPPRSPDPTAAEAESPTRLEQ